MAVKRLLLLVVLLDVTASLDDRGRYWIKGEVIRILAFQVLEMLEVN